MITAKEANKKTFESERVKELLTEKYYQEVLKKIEREILKQVAAGYFFVQLDAEFMYPVRDLVIKELERSGYKIGLASGSAIGERLTISWK